MVLSHRPVLNGKFPCLSDSYGSSLSAVFAAPEYEKPVETLKDLSARARETGTAVVLTLDTSLSNLLEVSN